MGIIEKNIKNFNDNYASRINNNKELLVKSFTKYYGKEYEEKIRDVIEKTNYFWYVSGFNSEIKEQISTNILKKALNKMLKIVAILGFNLDSSDIKCQLGKIVYNDDKISIDSGKIITTGDKKIDKILETLFGEDKIEKSDKNSTFDKLFLYSFNDKEQVMKDIFGEDAKYDSFFSKIVKVKEFLHDNYPYEEEQLNNYLYFYVFDEYMKTRENNKIIGSCTDKKISYPERRKISDIISDIINANEISCPFSVTLSEDVPVVAFNALLTSDLNFIHEINHSVKSLIFAYKMDNDNATTLKKSGICIYDGNQDNADILEEILNDIEAVDITRIFHDLGGNLFDTDILKHHYMNSNSYPKFYPLVIKFYSLYKDIIKDASISEDTNILYKRVNKEKLNEYAEFIDYVYKNYFDNDFPAEFIDKANKMIDDMSIDIKKEESLDDYIRELEESGKKVHRLN